MSIDAVGSAPWSVSRTRSGARSAVAVIVLRDGYHLDDDAHPAASSIGKLAKYKIPKKVIYVEDLPRTAQRQVRKGDLRRNGADQAQTVRRPMGVDDPITDVERI